MLARFWTLQAAGGLESLPDAIYCEVHVCFFTFTSSLPVLRHPTHTLAYINSRARSCRHRTPLHPSLRATNISPAPPQPAACMTI